MSDAQHNKPQNIDDVIRRIAGLMRLAEKAGTEEEAAAAAGKAQALMDQYHLESSAIDAKKDNTAPKITGKEVSGNHGRWAMMDWKVKMISWIADINGVKAIRFGPRRVQLFGKADNIQIVEYLSMFLCREVERLGIEVYWPQVGIQTGMNQRTYVQHFGIGAASRISQRMRAERESHRETAAQVNALMVVDKQLIADYISNSVGPVKTTHSKRRGSAAMGHGYEAGGAINWNKGLNAGDAPASQKRLG